MNEHEHQDHDEVGDQLLLGRPDDLAQLGDHLAVERRQGSCASRACRSRAYRDCLSVTSFTSLVVRLVDQLSLQGTRDLNPQPSVLETDALPVELVPSDGSPTARPPEPVSRAWPKHVENHQTGSLRGGPTAESKPRRRTRTAPGRSPAPLRWSRMTTAPIRLAPCPPRLRPDRRHHRVRHARGRREGQGAQGRGPAGDRLRRRRARLPDPRLHRRGRGRGLPRPEEPPLHPGRRAARAEEGDRREDRCATAGYAVEPAQVLVTNGGKQAIYDAFADAARPGRRGAPAGAVLDDLPGGDPAGRRRRRSRCSPTRPRTTRSPSSSSRPRAPTRTKVLLFVSPSNPTGAVYTADEVGAIGRWAEEHGLWVVTDEIYEHLVYDGVETGSMPVLVPGARRPLRRRQRRRQDLRDDRLAGRLDDRPDRRGQGRDQPAVARHLQRRQRLPAGRAGRRDRRPVRGRRDEGGLRPAPQDDRVDAERDRRRRLPDAARRVLRLPVGQGPARQGVRRPGRSTTSAELAELILDEAEVAVVPGEAFGSPGYLRLSYALGDDDLVEGVTRLQKLFSVTPARPGRRATCRALPKAHLHLHFTGSMRHATLLELAERDGIPLPDALRRRTGRRSCRPPTRRAGSGSSGSTTSPGRCCAPRTTYAGWCGRPPRTTSATAAGWLEIQVDPSGYAARFGGITAFTDLVLDAVPGRLARDRPRHGGRDRGQPHPAPAGRPHPGPAGRAVRRPRRGRLRAVQRRAPRRAPRTSPRRSGSPSGPGCCWCRTAASCAARTTSRLCLDHLHADRLGHGVRSVEDPALLDRIVAAGVALEVCPVSNVALGVYSDLTVGAAARAAGGRRDGRARRRRPAAVRLAAGRPVRHDARRPRAHRRAAGRAGPDVGPGLARARRRARPPCSPTSTGGWPRPD